MILAPTVDSFNDLWKDLPAISREAQNISSAMNDIRFERMKSITLGWRRDLFDQLEKIRNKCCKRNWDGEEATEISSFIIESARALVQNLPESIEIPEVTPDADGFISFDWILGKDHIYSVAVQSERLVFAGIISGERVHGQTPIQNDLSKPIEMALTKYFSSRKTA